MNAKTCGTIVVFVCSASFAVSEQQLPQELTTIQEAYQASMTNLHSGSGSGMVEDYVSSGGKGSKLQLIAKAKVKVIFDHNKFYVRLDYEKDDIHRLESRIIIHDGTAILVNRASKYIQPVHAEADIYETKPSLPIMRQTGFDYNPCELPLNILPVDLLSKLDYAARVAVKTDEKKDILGTFSYSAHPYIHSSFLASQKAGYNIITYREYDSNHKDFLHVSRDANWDRKQGVWYVKSIDTHSFRLDGYSERSIFQYTEFDPNPEVPKSQFSFEALELPPQAAIADRRPNAEEFVLYQSFFSTVDVAKLDTLADAVKALTTGSTPPQPPRLGKFYLLISGGLLCILGLLLLWRKHARKGGATPNS